MIELKRGVGGIRGGAGTLCPGVFRYCTVGHGVTQPG
jgi:hypothetical protein